MQRIARSIVEQGFVRVGRVGHFLEVSRFEKGLGFWVLRIRERWCGDAEAITVCVCKRGIPSHGAHPNLLETSTVCEKSVKCQIKSLSILVWTSWK